MKGSESPDYSPITSPRYGKKLRLLPLLILFAVQLIISCVVVKNQFPDYWSPRWIQDDAYISFRYANNLVQGRGLVYNPGDRVEGYTNFLWTLISSIPLLRGAEDPLPFMHRFSAFLWFGTYIILLLLSINLFREGAWGAPLALIPLAYHWSYNMWFFSGMETPLVSFFTVLTIFFFSFDPEKFKGSLLLTVLSAVGLIMTRPDAVFLLLALAVLGLALYWRKLFIEKKWVTYLLLPSLPLLLIYLPYTIWRVAYYGSFYPNTYYAKVAYLTYYSRGWEYLRTYFKVFPFAPYLLLVVLGALLSPEGNTRRFLWAALLGAVFVFFYVVRLGGDFMEWRFLTPITGVLYPAICVGAGVMVERIWHFGLRLAGKLHKLRDTLPREPVSRNTGLALGWIASVITVYLLSSVTISSTARARTTMMPGQETIALLGRYCDSKQYNWKIAGRLFDELLPEDVTIATTSAGIIPFYCARPCLDLHGLNDPVIAHEPVNPNHRGRMGHEHWLTDYNTMRDRGVDIYLYWVDPKPFAKSLATPPKKDFELVSVLLPDNRYTELLILNHDTVDVDELKKDPRLIFYDPENISERGGFYLLKRFFPGYELVDRIDLEDQASERLNQFKEIFHPERPHKNYHTKILSCKKPMNKVILEDNGRRIYNIATWDVHDVKPGKELLMIVRHDGTGHADYSIEVNGQEVPRLLSFRRAAECWDEAWIKIPAAMLKEGTNQFRIARTKKSPFDAELYYLWFLQPKGPGSSSDK